MERGPSWFPLTPPYIPVSLKMSDLHKFRFRPFDPSGTVRWSSYRAHFEMRLATEDVRDLAEKKCAFFQVNITEMFDYVASRFHPRKIETNDVTYDEIWAVLESRFKDRESSFYAECLFFRRSFNQGSETIDNFIDDLHRIASRANFGNFLERALVGQIVRGFGSESLIQEFSKENAPSLDTVTNRIRSYVQNKTEAQIYNEINSTLSPVALPTSSVGNHANSGAVLKLADRQPSTKPSPPHARFSKSRTRNKYAGCFSCGSSAHLRRDCPLRDAICHICKTHGHIAAVCRSAPTAQQTQPLHRPSFPIPNTGNQGRTYEPVHQLHAAPSTSFHQDHPFRGSQHTGTWTMDTPSGTSQAPSPSSNLAPLFNLTDSTSCSSPPPVAISVLLNGVETKIEIDSGAAFSVMSIDQFSRNWPGATLQPPTVNLAMWNGAGVEVLGEYTFDGVYRDRKVNLPIRICSGHGPVLLGRDGCAILGIQLVQGPIVGHNLLGPNSVRPGCAAL